MQPILILFAFLVSLTVHEYSHALVAFLQGDNTAKDAGRLTLNPIPHIDPLGTIIIPLIGLMASFPVIGWAKPVPFNPYNLKWQKWGSVAVALAGPISNFLQAIVFALGLRFVTGIIGLDTDNLLVLFLSWLVIINVFLGIFNFIPIPPLDGSKLLSVLFDKPKYRNILHFLETKGPILLLLLVFIDYASPVSFLGIAFEFVMNIVFFLTGIR